MVAALEAGLEEAYIVHFQQTAGSFAPTPPVQGVGPGGDVAVVNLPVRGVLHGSRSAGIPPSRPRRRHRSQRWCRRRGNRGNRASKIICRETPSSPVVASRGIRSRDAVRACAHGLGVRRAERIPSEIARIGYIQIVWVTALGYFVFGDFPDGFTILGALIVISSGAYIVHRESVVKRMVRED